MLGFFKKLVSPFARVKSFLGEKIRALFSGDARDETFDELEKLLYEADLGAKTAAELVDKIRDVSRKQKLTSEEVLAFLEREILSMLPEVKPKAVTHSPHVILMVGVNGSGKTTSLAKLASYYLGVGKKVLIAAGDTFRAAAIEQLETWSERLGADFVKAQPKSDPSAVAFDALQAAKSRGIDVVLIDTAGRLQTKTDLMQELAKIHRVCKKQISSAPHETLLVLDATIGQNALDQARTFHEFTPITGIILTKLDGTAKGGIAIAIQKELKLPILWVGSGESSDDLAPFDPKAFVSALLS